MLKLFGNMKECKHNFSFSFVPVFNCCVVVLQLCGQVNSDGPERLRGGGGGLLVKVARILVRKYELPLKQTNLGVAQALFDPCKIPF